MHDDDFSAMAQDLLHRFGKVMFCSKSHLVTD